MLDNCSIIETKFSYSFPSKRSLAFPVTSWSNFCLKPSLVTSSIFLELSIFESKADAFSLVREKLFLSRESATMKSFLFENSSCSIFSEDFSLNSSLSSILSIASAIDFELPDDNSRSSA